MSPRVPCVVVAVLSCLLASAMSAHAECAWVLWALESKRGSSSGTWVMVNWTIRDASGTDAGCQSKLRHDIEESRRAYGDAHVDLRDNSYYAISKGGEQIMSILRCLPDTIDPRTPKTK